MYKAYFDASFRQSSNISVLGYCIFNKEGKLIESKSIIRKDITDSHGAECEALLSLLNNIKEHFSEKHIHIYGDHEPLILSVRRPIEKVEKEIYKQCIHLINECNIHPSNIHWVPREENFADAYTRIKVKKIQLENNETKKVKKQISKKTEIVPLHLPTFILNERSYLEYRFSTKGNGNLTLKMAEKKLNRNIRRAGEKSIQLMNGIVVYIYHNLHIYTKNSTIVKVNNIRTERTGYLYFKEHTHLLEEILVQVI